MPTKIILIPGNGGGRPTDNWFPHIQSEFSGGEVEVVAREFPDNQLARAAYWLPFLKDELRADENTILIGHSSGAIAAMRYAETHRIFGSILVGCYHTDLGVDAERQSGYFTTPWHWDAIRKNQNWTVLFASTDDPWIPIAEPRFVSERLGCDYREFTDQGHFGGDYQKDSFPELVQALREKIGG